MLRNFENAKDVIRIR